MKRGKIKASTPIVVIFIVIFAMAGLAWAQQKESPKVDPKKVEQGKAMQDLKTIGGQGPKGTGDYQGRAFDGSKPGKGGSTLDSEKQPVRPPTSPPVATPKRVDPVAPPKLQPKPQTAPPQPAAQPPRDLMKESQAKEKQMREEYNQKANARIKEIQQKQGTQPQAPGLKTKEVPRPGASPAAAPQAAPARPAASPPSTYRPAPAAQPSRPAPAPTPV